MKLLTSLNIILALLLSLNLQHLNAQGPATLEDNLVIPTDWEISENWLHDYRENLTPYASLTWINDVISEGAQMLTSSEAKGIILVEVAENEDQLTAIELAEESPLEGKDVDLFASEDVKGTGLSATAEWIGTIGGEQVIVQKIYTLSEDGNQVLSVLSIVPANHFSPLNIHAFETSQQIANQLSLEDNGLLSHLN